MQKLEKMLTQTDVSAGGIRLSLRNNGEEAAHAYLYILNNDFHEQPFGFIEDVQVKEELRGQGYGSKLMRALISKAKEMGCYKLICTSRKERTKVHDLYRKLGFAEYGREFRMDLKE
jgi:GNAT superfamily N-acetyltransferase